MDKKTIFENLLAIVTGFTALYFIFDSIIFLYIALGVGVAGLLIPQAGYGIVWVWLKITHGIGWVNSRILLTLIFFVILFPIAQLQKLFSKDELLLKNKGKSTFFDRQHKYSGKDLQNPW